MKPLLVLLLVTAFVAGAFSKKAKTDACRYKKGPNKWTECVDGKMSLSKIRTEEAGHHCEPTRLIVRPCGKSKCKYAKADWSECKEDGMQTRTMTLLKGTGCEATKTKSRKCKKGCKYEKGNWSPCDPTTKKMTRELTLTEGGDHCEPMKTREKKCRKARKGDRKERRGRKQRGKRAHRRKPRKGSTHLQPNSVELGNKTLMDDKNNLPKIISPFGHETVSMTTLSSSSNPINVKRKYQNKFNSRLRSSTKSILNPTSAQNLMSTPVNSFDTTTNAGYASLFSLSKFKPKFGWWKRK